jgi:hypothetical protein
MSISTTPLRHARQDDQNGYIICLLWSSGAEEIKYPIYYGMLTSTRRHHPTTPRRTAPGGPHRHRLNDQARHTLTSMSNHVAGLTQAVTGAGSSQSPHACVPHAGDRAGPLANAPIPSLPKYLHVLTSVSHV